MPDDFLVARNPDLDSALPYLIRVPLGPNGIVLKTREIWPRTSKVYCHRAEGWPPEPEIVERIPVRSCSRRGPAIDLVLDRGRENRSQLVVTQARGREMIFWQSPRTTKQARPNVSIPTRRASGQTLQIIVDTAEKYAYKFSQQQASTAKRRLPAGDYAVEHGGTVVAAVERKSLDDLAGSLMAGKLTYALAELSALPYAALVVEDRYSALFKLEHVAGGQIADALAETQARFPAVTIMFAETRPLAQEWTYRFLGAALSEHVAHLATAGLESSMAAAGPVPDAPPTTAEIRAWAKDRGLVVPDRGRIPAGVMTVYRQSTALLSS